MNKWDKRHLRNINVYLRNIDRLFSEAVVDVAKIAQLIDGLGDEPFQWSDSPLAQSRIDDIVATLRRRLEQTITDGIRTEWELSNDKNDAICDLFLNGGSASMGGDGLLEYYSRDEDALNRLLSRKVNGRTLSKRVWEMTDGFKDEMEMALGIGIREGKSADSLSRDIRSYLKEPNKLFRRVRDEYGNLQLSKNAKAYHPGQGVYRSSYMNAKRVTVTDTNTAYRTADHERWQKMDFVIGIEIRLSNNHNCKGIPAGTFVDICDDLKGKYPKDFMFTGWHPFCRCYAVPILRNQSDLDARNEFIRESDKAKAGDDLEVREMPKQFNDWVEKNKERIDRAKEKGTLPYFIRDNEKYINKQVKNNNLNIRINENTNVKQNKNKINTIQKEIYQRKDFPSGGCVETPIIGEQTKQEKKKNNDLAVYLAKYYGYKLRLLPNNPNAGKNIPQPDALNLINKNKTELKVGSPTTNSCKNTIQNGIKEASRQGCKDVIISFDKEVTMISVYQGIAASLQPGRALSIENITLLFVDGTIKKISASKVRELLSLKN